MRESNARLAMSETRVGVAQRRADAELARKAALTIEHAAIASHDGDRASSGEKSARAGHEVEPGIGEMDRPA
jgi:hypothetical protein